MLNLLKTLLCGGGALPKDVHDLPGFNRILFTLLATFSVQKRQFT